METNRGYKVEKAMMKWFKGKSHPKDCVDFQTTKALYEVKSCRLFLECINGNNKRRYVIKPHKKIRTTQLGRFHIKLENHIRLKICAEEEKKIPKYIFVILVGKQKVWRLKSWEQVNSIIDQKRKIIMLRIKDLFNEKWEEE